MDKALSKRKSSQNRRQQTLVGRWMDFDVNIVATYL